MPGEHQAQFSPLCLHSEADEGAYHLDRTFHSSIASDSKPRCRDGLAPRVHSLTPLALQGFCLAHLGR